MSDYGQLKENENLIARFVPGHHLDGVSDDLLPVFDVLGWFITSDKLEGFTINGKGLREVLEQNQMLGHYRYAGGRAGTTDTISAKGIGSPEGFGPRGAYIDSQRHNVYDPNGGMSLLRAISEMNAYDFRVEAELFGLDFFNKHYGIVEIGATLTCIEKPRETVITREATMFRYDQSREKWQDWPSGRKFDEFKERIVPGFIQMLGLTLDDSLSKRNALKKPASQNDYLINDLEGIRPIEHIDDIINEEAVFILIPMSKDRRKVARALNLPATDSGKVDTRGFVEALWGQYKSLHQSRETLLELIYKELCEYYKSDIISLEDVYYNIMDRISESDCDCFDNRVRVRNGDIELLMDYSEYTDAQMPVTHTAIWKPLTPGDIYITAKRESEKTYLMLSELRDPLIREMEGEPQKISLQSWMNRNELYFDVDIEAMAETEIDIDLYRKSFLPAISHAASFALLSGTKGTNYRIEEDPYRHIFFVVRDDGGIPGGTGYFPFTPEISERVEAILQQANRDKITVNNNHVGTVEIDSEGARVICYNNSCYPESITAMNMLAYAANAWLCYMEIEDADADAIVEFNP